MYHWSSYFLLILFLCRVNITGIDSECPVEISATQSRKHCTAVLPVLLLTPILLVEPGTNSRTGTLLEKTYNFFLIIFNPWFVDMKLKYNIYNMYNIIEFTSSLYYTHIQKISINILYIYLQK